ncbi:MAG: hypothetical protein ACYC8T_07465 [Myxococcaceae bacterium]
MRTTAPILALSSCLSLAACVAGPPGAGTSDARFESVCSSDATSVTHLKDGGTQSYVYAEYGVSMGRSHADIQAGIPRRVGIEVVFSPVQPESLCSVFSGPELMLYIAVEEDGGVSPNSVNYFEGHPTYFGAQDFRPIVMIDDYEVQNIPPQLDYAPPFAGFPGVSGTIAGRFSATLREWSRDGGGPAVGGTVSGSFCAQHCTGRDQLWIE